MIKATRPAPTPAWHSFHACALPLASVSACMQLGIDRSYEAPRAQGCTGKVGRPRAQGKFVRPRTDPVQHGFSKCHAIPHHPFHIIYSTSSIPASGRMDGVVYSLPTAVWQPWSRDQKQQLARHPPKGTHHPCVPQRLTSEACPSAAERILVVSRLWGRCAEL